MLHVGTLVQEELAHTQTDLVMYRQRMHDLIQLVESGKKPRLYLDGPRGEVSDEHVLTTG